MHRIEVEPQGGQKDPVADKVLSAAREMGLPVTGVRRIRAYTIDKEFSPESLSRLQQELFTDPIVEVSSVDEPLASRHSFSHLLEVGFKPGVMDTAGSVAAEVIGDVLKERFGEGEAVYTSAQLLLEGEALSAEDVERLAREYVANDDVQQWAIAPYAKVREGKHRFDPPRVRLNRMPKVEYISLDRDDDGLAELSSSRRLALNKAEMVAIRNYYSRPDIRARRAELGLPADPSDAELELFGQTWSEHCKHKIFNAEIDYFLSDVPDAKSIRIDSLFKTFIEETTKRLRADRPWIKSALSDNAGVVEFDGKIYLAIKVETHNYPTGVAPYGGAETGLDGVLRDISGTGAGTGWILIGIQNFGTGFPGYAGNLRPKLHPRRLLEEQRAGTESAGNKVGFPTPFGLAYFHDGYMAKPCMFAGAVGRIPAEVGGKSGYSNDVLPGDRIVTFGGRVGIDGIHGVTGASLQLDKKSKSSEVQMGSPYMAKKILDFQEEARDRGLYHGVTDSGGGGIGSGVGEMARKCGTRGGCKLNLDQLPLKYEGLHPWQILISESQERMYLAVDPSRVQELVELGREHGVEVTDIGEFVDSGHFSASYGGKPVADLDMSFLHGGVPKMKLRAVWKSPEARGLAEPETTVPADYGDMLGRILERPNMASKEYIARQFDHEVQGTSVIKPLVGKDSDVFSDAVVIRPDIESVEGMSVAIGFNPAYGNIDTYHMTAIQIDEAIRRLVAVGSMPDRVAALDNFCWPSPLPSPENPDAEYKTAQLVRANQALQDYALAFGAPMISGKDSMSMDGKIPDADGTLHRVSAPPTLQITVLGKLPDIAKAVTMDVKNPGDAVYMLGTTKDELGGSEYYEMSGHVGLNVPKVDAVSASALYRSLFAAMQDGLVRSARGCYKGGLGVALAQTAFAGGYGMDIDLRRVPVEGLDRDDKVLFSESASRFVVTVAPEAAGRFEAQMVGNVYARIGIVRADDRLRFSGYGGNILDAGIGELKERWQAPFRVAA